MGHDHFLSTLDLQAAMYDVLGAAMKWRMSIVAVLVGLCGVVLAADHQYCVVGAGPGGKRGHHDHAVRSLPLCWLQDCRWDISYNLLVETMLYLTRVLPQVSHCSPPSSTAAHCITVGSFYTHYPRHRTLISINKRHTGTASRHHAATMLSCCCCRLQQS